MAEDKTVVTDVYQLDTSQAQKSLKDLGNETEATKKKQKGFADFMRGDLEKAFFSAQAQYDLATRAIRFLGTATIEGAANYLQSLTAVTRLDGALAHLGNTSDGLRERLKEQADAIEALTGVDDAHTTELQAMLVQFGVAPQMLERFTDAAYRLAYATGQDATTAARKLARANGEGREEFKAYGINLGDVAEGAAGFGRVLDAVEANFVSLNDQIPKQVRELNTLKKTWEDMKKSMGEVALGLLSKVMSSTIAKSDQDASDAAAWAKAQRQNREEKEAASGSEHFDLETVKIDTEKWKKEVARLAELKAKARLDELNRLEQEQNNKRELIEKQETAVGAMQMKFIKEGMAQDKLFSDEAARVAQEKADRITNIERTNYEARERMYRQSQETMAKIDQETMSFAKSTGQELLSFGIGLLKEQLLANTQYTRAYKEQIIAQMTIGMKKEDADRKRAEVESEWADEANANLAKATAGVLANIAEQAAIKAIMSAAEAVASYASNEYDAAAKYGMAAALYTGVAAAAGGGAALISSNRGMTSSEKQSLADNQKAFEASRRREAKQDAERGSDTVGAQTNVYFLGITGLTEAAQGRELARVRQMYEETKTGKPLGSG